MVHSGQLLRSAIKTLKSKHDTARAMIPASFTSNLTNTPPIHKSARKGAGELAQRAPLAP
eukprot:893350-Prymnesium_polylepis.1